LTPTTTFEFVLSKSGPPESPKHVPPVAAFVDIRKYVLGGELLSDVRTGSDLRRVSPPNSFLP